MNKKRICLVLLCAVISLYLIKISYGIIRWETYMWLPSYFSSKFKIEDNYNAALRKTHLIFIICDHYEPGFGENGIKTNREWLQKYKTVVENKSDSFGNKFKYTWFYAYDHKNGKVLEDLRDFARQGYGEIEFHWHHPTATNKEFTELLDEALVWFKSYGIFSEDSNGRPKFAFIHGNWALDNSQPICGVNRELDILVNAGSYADFTFSTIGTPSQPSKINSLYYPVDDDNAKSYNDGIDSAVGVNHVNRLLIFQGPISMSWDGGYDYGAVEYYSLPTKKRVERWIAANIHVKDRPEWIFVKVYSHGIQSQKVILNNYLSKMIIDLISVAREKDMMLHFMTAREGFNVVKAAEDKLYGNPEDFKNYKISPPKYIQK